MSTDKFHQHAAKMVRDMDHEPILIAAKVEYHAVVSHEIDGRAELALDVGRAAPPCPVHDRKPGADRPFGVPVSLPELLECPAGDHLHASRLSRHQNGDNHPPGGAVAHLQ